MDIINEDKKPTFDKSCELLYSLTSNRIRERYELRSKDYVKNHGKMEGHGNKGTAFDFYPEDRNLVNRILKNKRNEDNPYLITPKILPVIVEKLGFNDKAEVFWGDDIKQYLEKLFKTMLQDVNHLYSYRKHWTDFLSANESIDSLYYTFFSENEENLDYLEDEFLDFTYNNLNKKTFVECDDVLEFMSESEKISQNNCSVYLDFKNLPNKLKVFTDEVLIPIIDYAIQERFITDMVKNSEEPNVFFEHDEKFEEIKNKLKKLKLKSKKLT